MKVIFICILFILLQSCCKESIKETTITKIDTLYKERIVKDTFQVPGKITYLRDTIIQTKPFEVRFDTVIYKTKYKTDTLHLKYNFPENKFTYSSSQIDSLLEIHKDTLKEKTIIEEKSFFDKFKDALIYLIIGLISGFAFFYLVNQKK